MAYELLCWWRMSDRSRISQREVPPTFGARLRTERERRKISIASIAENTKILGALLEGLENNDVSRWPTGFYRRAFIRAYATAIGLDPEPVVREFSERFPDPDAAPPPLPPGATAPLLPPASDAVAGKPPAVRVAVPESRTWFSGGRLIRAARFRCFAVAIDAFVLSVMGLGLFAVLGSFWAPLTIATATYYFGSILLLGNTPGVCLFAARRPPSTDRHAIGGGLPSFRQAIAKALRRNHWRDVGHPTTAS